MMGQFDDMKSIAMLFTGAFLVSFGVIVFLNFEVQSRSNHGVKIRNENLFEVLGRKIYQMISALKEKNANRRSLLYHFFIPNNSTRASSLKNLQYSFENSTAAENMTKHFNKSQRHLRHERKIKKLTELLKERNSSFSREIAFDLEKQYKSNGDGFVALVNNISNNRITTNSGFNSSNKELSDEDLEVHQHCYTTNDVLEIIAVTCLVNFIFWFIIILCVNVYTKNQKMWKFNSFESLISIHSGSESELNENHAKKDEDLFSLNRQNCLKGYVDALTIEPEAESTVNESRNLFSWSFLKANLPRHRSEEKWTHQRFVHPSTVFFDSSTPTNLISFKKKNFVSHDKNNKIVNSFSMENLIF